MPKKYRVELTPEQRRQLERTIKVGKAAARTVLHAHILLLVDEGAGGVSRTDETVVAALGTSLSTVSRTRRRFAEGGLAATGRKPRKPQAPLKMDGAREAHLIALACMAPPEGQARWTLRLLADRFVELEVGVPISHETVRQVLKRGRCSLGG